MAMRALAIFCCLWLFAAPASAEENLSLFLYGALSCDEWNGPFVFGKSSLQSWLLSYLAQQADGEAYRLKILPQIKTDQIVQWVDDYCKTHPLDGLAVASTTLMNELAERAAASK
jgi:hypothetical protein